ncbi:hypothetical protein BsWGS_22109 [Bradybaena similaris]
MGFFVRLFRTGQLTPAVQSLRQCFPSAVFPPVQCIPPAAWLPQCSAARSPSQCSIPVNVSPPFYPCQYISLHSSMMTLEMRGRVNHVSFCLQAWSEVLQRTMVRLLTCLFQYGLYAGT